MEWFLFRQIPILASKTKNFGFTAILITNQTEHALPNRPLVD